MLGELFTVNSKVAASRKVSPDWSHCLSVFPLSFTVTAGKQLAFLAALSRYVVSYLMQIFYSVFRYIYMLYKRTDQ